MQKQPAVVNYFFGDVYRECGRTITSVFYKWKDRIVDYWELFCDSWSDLWDDIVDVFTFDEPVSGFFAGIGHGAKFGWHLALLLLNFIFAPAICAVFSLLYILIMALIMIGIYFVFSITAFIDWVYRKIRHLSNGCPSCQEKFGLPIYVCPSCGAEHTKLVPSKYGIFKRTCECGEKLPTTFLNGRGKLDGICPHCHTDLTDAGAHREIWIPILGGPSSGKTCLITMTINRIEELAENSRNNISFSYQENTADGREDLYEANRYAMSLGVVPDKTDASAGEKRMKYYQFNIKKEGANFSNFVSLCDMPGEVFADDSELAQVGFLHADAAMIVVDPLCIQDYREELINDDPDFDPYDYSASDMKMEDVTTMLVSTLENMKNKINVKVIKTAAIVFTKMDIPGLEEKIGPSAVRSYMASHKMDEAKATNALCENFLKQYGETNFLNIIKQRFPNYRFFTCSPLGHNADGTEFEPVRVEDSLLWILSKHSPEIKF